MTLYCRIWFCLWNFMWEFFSNWAVTPKQCCAIDLTSESPWQQWPCVGRSAWCEKQLICPERGAAKMTGAPLSATAARPCLATLVSRGSRDWRDLGLFLASFLNTGVHWNSHRTSLRFHCQIRFTPANFADRFSLLSHITFCPKGQWTSCQAKLPQWKQPKAL